MRWRSPTKVFNEWCDRKFPSPYDGAWKRWYAWHPVRIEDEWVWLEDVERRRYLRQVKGENWIGEKITTSVGEAEYRNARELAGEHI